MTSWIVTMTSRGDSITKNLVKFRMEQKIILIVIVKFNSFVDISAPMYLRVPVKKTANTVERHSILFDARMTRIIINNKLSLFAHNSID